MFSIVSAAEDAWCNIFTALFKQRDEASKVKIIVYIVHHITAMIIVNRYVQSTPHITKSLLQTVLFSCICM